MTIRLFKQTEAEAPSASATPDFALLIVENLPYLEKQCRKAVAGHRGEFSGAEGGAGGPAQDNEADELLNEVLDHLKAQDFRVLREFKGKAKLTTYLTSVIANLVVDLVRKKRGRSRVKDRAQELGEAAVRLYEAVYLAGHSLAEAHELLRTNYGMEQSEEELARLLERMRGRGGQHATLTDWPYSGKEIVTEEGVELVVPDPSGTAEEILAEEQRQTLSGRVLAEVLGELSGEERLMISWRFPTGQDQEPKGNREIASLLGLTEKAVDNRIRRILTRCRETILRQGLSLDDLVPAGT